MNDEIITNALASEDFYFFVRWMFFKQRGFKWQKADHHQIICDALMRVYRGECKRLIINIPPRYSKSQTIIYFMAWTLGRHPDSEYIYTSYSARLAANSSWQVREIINTEAYQAIFPNVKLKHDSKAKDEWRTTDGGLIYAAGSGGTITGYGAGKLRPEFGGAILMDDLHKADEARSDTMRNNVIDWFQNTLESRKNSPDTPMIVIMQRLHEEDIAGFLLGGGNGEVWEHLSLPAIKEDGTALWPEKHDIETLRTMEKASPYVFSGQYLQRPAPPSGGLFKPDQIKFIDAIPAEPITWWRAWDLASTVNGDYTAGVKMGKTKDGRFIIADVVRLRVGPDERDAAMINTANMDGRNVKISIPQDPGQAGRTQVLYLTRSLAGFSVHSSPESGDKITRAEPFAAQINIGNVMMLTAEWNRNLMSEMIMFPNGAHDDQIDACSRAFSHLIGPAGVQISQSAFNQFSMMGKTRR